MKKFALAFFLFLLPFFVEAHTAGLKPKTERPHAIVKTICIVGSHGTGKTTLSYTVADDLKRQGVNAIAIAESVRESPCKFNGEHTKNTTEWVMCHQRCKEIACEEQGYTFFVEDRSILDSFAYHIGAGLPLDGAIGSLCEYALKQFATNYDLVIFVRTGDSPLIADGIRDERQDYRKKIDGIFADLIKKSGIPKNKVYEVEFSDLLFRRLQVDSESLKVTLK